MDHTILNIDAEVSWKHFLADEGLAPEASRTEADHHWRLYIEGRANVEEYLRFQLREFVGRTVEDMQDLGRRHYDKHLKTAINPEARRLVTLYRRKNIPTVLLTGSNLILSQPIADELGTVALLGTEPEIIDGCFTGKIVGSYVSSYGKRNKAHEFCAGRAVGLHEAAFFADSINDLPLLESVGFPVVVNPGKNLLSVAQTRNWPVKQWTH